VSDCILDDRGSIPGRGKVDFSSSLVQTNSEAHPASYPMASGVPFPGGKARPGRDADHSPHLLPRSRMSTSYTLSLGACMAVAGQSCFSFSMCKTQPVRHLVFTWRLVTHFSPLAVLRPTHYQETWTVKAVQRCHSLSLHFQHGNDATCDHALPVHAFKLLIITLHNKIKHMLMFSFPFRIFTGLNTCLLLRAGVNSPFEAEARLYI
jgi:hypothetical protein